MHELVPYTVAGSLEGLPRDLAIQDCTAFWEGYWLSMDCEWLNHPTKIRTASNKLFQLRTALNEGISVPEYVITNNLDLVDWFKGKHEKIVVKSLGPGYVKYGSKNLKSYTRRLKEIEANLDERLSLGPAIFQREIERRAEIRVTVVDENCFSVRCDCNVLPRSIVDLRRIDYEKNAEAFTRAADVPEIENWSRVIVAKLGLRYAALDWVVDHSGKPFFLECNPLGSFKWAEIVSGFNITEAIASALLRSKDRPL